MNFTAISVSDEVLENLLAPAIVRFNLGRRDELESTYFQVADGAVKITDLPPNVVDLVLQAGVAADTRNSVFDSFVYQNLYQGKLNTTGGLDPNDPYATLGYPSILAALTSTQNVDDLTLLFTRAVAPQWFRRQDAGAVIRLTVSNDLGLPLINTLLLDNTSHNTHHTLHADHLITPRSMDNLTLSSSHSATLSPITLLVVCQVVHSVEQFPESGGLGLNSADGHRSAHLALHHRLPRLLHVQANSHSLCAYQHQQRPCHCSSECCVDRCTMARSVQLSHLLHMAKHDLWHQRCAIMCRWIREQGG